MAARLTKAAAGLLGACIGWVIGPLACLPALSSSWTQSTKQTYSPCSSCLHAQARVSG